MEPVQSLEANKDAVEAVNCASSGGMRETKHSTWADSYDSHLLSVGYTVPSLAAEAGNGLFSETDRKDVKILDVAAGTGLLGCELRRYGFFNIDALDPSPGMLKFAKERNIYTNIFCEFLTDKELPIDEDTYDCVTCSGGFMDGHIPCAGLYEMIRITKPGGYIVITLREEYLFTVPEYKDKLEPLMDKIEEQGKWKKSDESSCFRLCSKQIRCSV